MNAAEVLLRYFTPIRSFDVSFPDLIAAYSSVSKFLQAEAARGNEEAEIANDSMPTLWGFVRDEYVDKENPTFTNDEKTFPQECKLALMEAKRLMNEGSPKYDETTRESIRSLINDIPEELNSLSLPQELNLYVLRLTSEVRTALDEYEMTGDFKLDEAFSRLQASLNSIAAIPKSDEEQGKFVKFLNKKLTPCLMVLNLASGIAYSSLQSYQIYTQIGSSSQQTSVAQPPSGTHQTADGSENPDSHE